MCLCVDVGVDVGVDMGVDMGVGVGNSALEMLSPPLMGICLGPARPPFANA